MTDATRNQLEQAYRLIQQDDLDKAIAILKPILAAQPDNLDAWWLMANAVSEPADAREALDNVLRLDPSHWQARDLLNKLNEEYPDFTGAPAAPPLPSSDTSLDDLFSSPAPSSGGISSAELDRLLSGESDRGFDSGFSDATSEAEDVESIFGEPGGSGFSDQLDSAMGGDPFSDPFASREPGFVEQVEVEEKPRGRRGRAEKPEKAEKAEKPGRKQRIKEPKQALPYEDALVAERRVNNRPNPVALIVLLILVVGVVGGGATIFLLPRLSGTSQAGTGTPVAQVTGQPGALATGQATGETTPTVETVATAVPGASDLASLIQATSDLFVANQFSDAKAAVVQSTLGDTLQVQVCGNVGPELQSDVYRAMDIVAEQAFKAHDSLKAVGLEVTSCAQPGVTLYRAVASIEAVIRYIEGGMSNKRDYRAAWKRS